MRHEFVDSATTIKRKLKNVMESRLLLGAVRNEFRFLDSFDARAELGEMSQWKDMSMK